MTEGSRKRRRKSETPCALFSTQKENQKLLFLHKTNENRSLLLATAADSPHDRDYHSDVVQLPTQQGAVVLIVAPPK